MDTRNAHTVPYNELCHHRWDSLTPSVHIFLCNPIRSGQFCELPSECLALTVSAAECVCRPCTISACFHAITHHTQKSKHTSYFKVCHGFGRPPIFNL